MARFSDQPSQDPLLSTTVIPGTDTATGDDVSLTPEVITNYVQQNMGLASGSTDGLISGSSAGKLAGLYSNAEINAFLAQVGQIAIPFFHPNPEDGTIEVFENNLDNDILIDNVAYGMSSGSTIMTVRIDGVPVTGLINIPVDSSGGNAGPTAARTLAVGSVLGLTFSSSGTPENLRVSFAGSRTLV